uniref:Ycf34 n=1 Tax=Laurencieae sp. TaxID=2007162 RepID=A0A1Z1M2M2_9FLOR|nr:hypothetical protein [Laurencieae sp.]
MCICINCRHIHNCITYKFIEKQHNKNKVLRNNNNSFIPINTTININVNKNNEEILIDWDLVECLSFVEKPGNWLSSIKSCQN